jgi:hypothetical protein
MTMISRIALSLSLAAALGAPARAADVSLFQPSPMTRIEASPTALTASPAPAAEAAPRPAPTRVIWPGPYPSAAPADAAASGSGASIAPTRADAAPAIATQQAPAPLAATPAAVGATRLRHLPNNAQGYRLQGEIGASEWPVFFTDAEASGPIKLQLGYLSAVSIAPEASRLVVTLNDVEIGRADIQAPHAVRTLTFDAPAGLARPGFNALRVSVDQRHRVDCSLEATYELWTQIDPAQTGFVFADATRLASIADLPALPPNPQGAMQIRLMLGDQAELGGVDRALRAVQAVALNGRFEQVLVDSEAGVALDPYGVNLAVGPYQQLRQLPGLEGLRAPSGPLLTMRPAEPGGRATIVATGLTREDVDVAVAQLERAQSLRGSQPGLRAAASLPGVRVDGEQRLRLKDLGVPSVEFSGRLFRTAFNVMMPPDFYGADYAKAQINLAGGYAAGLTSEAQIVVSVNGRNVMGDKLAKSSGEVFERRVVPIPLSALRPGLNRIEFEAQLPTAADKSCDPLVTMKRAQRFLLLDQTELVLPEVARIARMPEIAVTTTGGFPYAEAGRRPRLFMPKPDRETIAAAAMMAARMAVSAGRVIELRATTRSPALGEEATIVMGAAPALDRETLQAAGLDAELVSAVWAGQTTPTPLNAERALLAGFEATSRYNQALQRNLPAECRGAAGLPRASAKAVVAPETSGRGAEALAREWRQTQRGSIWSFGRHLAEGAGEGLGAVKQGASVALRKLAPERFEDDLSRVVRPQTSLVIAQSNLNGEAAGVWTLVTAPTSGQLMENMACAVDPRIWAQWRGRVAALDPDEAEVSALRAADLDFVPTRPLSVGNARLIAAGWFSSNRWSYAGLVLLLAIALGSTTFFLVRGLGRRQM